MDDLIKRLRSGKHNEQVVTLGGVAHDTRCLAAADEIERLMNEVKLLREAYERGKPRKGEPGYAIF